MKFKFETISNIFILMNINLHTFLDSKSIVHVMEVYILKENYDKCISYLTIKMILHSCKYIDVLLDIDKLMLVLKVD